MKRVMRRFLGIMTVILMAIALTVPVSAASVKLSATSKTLSIGSSFTLTLNNTSKSGSAKAGNSRVTVKKSAKNTWKITAKKSGKVTVTVKCNKKSYKCKITVKKAAFTDLKPTIKVSRGSWKKNPEGQWDAHPHYRNVKITWSKLSGASYYEVAEYEYHENINYGVMHGGETETTKNTYKKTKDYDYEDDPYTPCGNPETKFRVRGVKKVNGKKYYSQWSNYSATIYFDWT